MSTETASPVLLRHNPLLAIGRSPSATIIVFFVALVLYGTLRLQGSFFALHNLSTVGSEILAPLLLGAAASVALLGGVVDLSMGLNVGVSAAIFAWVYNATGSVSYGMLAALAFGACVGIVNAIAVVVIGANGIIATLATLAALTGLQLFLHQTAKNEFAFIPSLYDNISKQLFGLPILLYPVIGLYVLAELVLRYSRYGQHLKAVGGNPVAARRAGINAARTQFLLYILVAVACSATGIIFVAQIGSAPATLGGGPFLLQVLGGALLGGFSITHGGVGSPLGAMFGVFSLFLMSNILDLSNAITYWQSIVTGILILVAVYLDGIRSGDRFG